MATISTILVPQGAEYQAVQRGLKAVCHPPQVVPLPVGPGAVAAFLPSLPWPEDSEANLLVMGLCGSLSPALPVGAIVLYRGCQDGTSAGRGELPCGQTLTDRLYHHLGGQPALVRALTCGRVIHSAAEKQRLGQDGQAQVVDMEGMAILQQLRFTPVAVAMLRVVSDDVYHDLPDLSHCFTPAGQLQPWPMARQFVRQPIAAGRLIRGSLKALAVLQQTTTALFSPP